MKNRYRWSWQRLQWIPVLVCVAWTAPPPIFRHLGDPLDWRTA